MQEAALAVEEGRVQDIPFATLQQCDVVGCDALHGCIRVSNSSRSSICENGVSPWPNCMQGPTFRKV